MPYETGTASDAQDLLQKLETFLTVESPSPWTVVQSVTAASPGGLYISDDNDLAVQLYLNGKDDGFYVHRSEGYDSPVDPLPTNLPGAHQSIITRGHQCDLLGTNYEAYHFYSNFDPTAGPIYCHGVVEIQSGWYRHFGFGILDKFGTYDGGEYSYGHYHDQGSNSDQPYNVSHAWPFDGIGTSNVATGRFCVRFRPNANGWGGTVQSPLQAWAITVQSNITDADGRLMTFLRGGVRQGYYMNHFFEMVNSSAYNGFKPLVPIPVFVYDQPPAPDEYYLIGYGPDIRMINMDGITPGQSLTIGADTWDCYPMGRKRDQLDNIEGTGVVGLAYKRLV